MLERTRLIRYFRLLDKYPRLMGGYYLRHLWKERGFDETNQRQRKQSRLMYRRRKHKKQVGRVLKITNAAGTMNRTALFEEEGEREKGRFM